MREALRHLRADVARYRELDPHSSLPVLLAGHQGIWALACHRFGHWAHDGGGWGLRVAAALWRKGIEMTTGISIRPEAEIGPGLYIGHFGGIFVGAGVRIGPRCSLSQGVTIGFAARDGREGSPVLGERVYVAPGAKVFGPISIGDGAALGANAVVRDDVPAGALAGGIPARVLRGPA